MTSEIIIPRTGLDVWAKQHLTNLIQAKTQPEFDRAFDNFIAQNVTVEFNGQSLTRDQYKKKLQGSRPMRISANTVVNILNTVQVPTGGASVIQPVCHPKDSQASLSLRVSTLESWRSRPFL